jgi:hypothetical protein
MSPRASILAAVLLLAGCVTFAPRPQPPAAAGISWMMANSLGSQYGKPDINTVARIIAWHPGWQTRNLFIGECCATQGVYDFTAFDADIASNKLWLAPYATKVKVCMEWGSRVTLRWNGNSPTLATNTGYQVRPQWFYDLAPNPQDLSGGAGPGSDLYDAQVPAASEIIRQFISHEGTNINALGIAWEPDWGTNYSIAEAAIASSVVSVARANGVLLCEGELGMPIYGVYSTWPGSNSYDAIAFHEAEWSVRSLDYGDAENNPGLRYDQLFDAIGALGKPMFLDLMETFHSCNPTVNPAYADRFVKAILMMRKAGVIAIAPVNYRYGVVCAPGQTIGAGQGCYIDSNNIPTPVGQAILNMERLIGNNLCATSAVQYPFYSYTYGSNTFVWIAEGHASTGMVLSGWSSPPSYARDGSFAPTNTLSHSPIVLTGNGRITLH